MSKAGFRPLSEFCDQCRKITYGIVQPGKLHAEGVPIVRVNNFRGNSLDLTDRLAVAPEIEAKYHRSRPKPGDLLVSLVGSIGQVAVAPKDVNGWNLARAVGLVPFDDARKARWAFYALQMAASQQFIQAHANTTVQATFNLKDLARIPIPAFEGPAQEEALSALLLLDDKIELNRRLNETLEAIARAVFKDWFVDFGPTRRKAAGETDPVAILGGLLPDPAKAAPLAAHFPSGFGANGLPEGWEERTVNDDFVVEMGQSPPGSTYNENGEGLPFFQGRRDFQFRFPEKRVYCTAPTRIAEADWTLVSVRAPVGDINRAWERCCIGRGVGAMMHKQGVATFTYYVGLHLKTELASYDKDGTVFGSINQKQLKGLTLAGTNSNAARAFDALFAPTDALIRNNTGENQILATTRDLLLPKLMSGEIRLKDAEDAA